LLNKPFNYREKYKTDVADYYRLIEGISKLLYSIVK